MKREHKNGVSRARPLERVSCDGRPIEPDALRCTLVAHGSNPISPDELAVVRETLRRTFPATCSNGQDPIEAVLGPYSLESVCRILRNHAASIH